MIKNLNLAQKLAVSLLLSASLSAHAQKVSFNGERMSLKNAFERLESVSKYKFEYNSSQLDVNHLVTLRQKNTDVLQIVGQLLQGTGFTYTVRGNYIVIARQQSQPGKGQKRKVSGVVRDANGDPIIGATIKQKGSTVGVISDLDGRFEVEVPADAQLEVSYVGYAPLTVNAAGNSLTLTLREDTKLMQEVVVVGYGVQKKVNLTGSVSSVKGGDLDMRPVTDASQSLQGLVPGLLVSNNNTGRPGATGSLRLRGQGNLSGTGNPYILVDGIEMSLADVNPNDIESISVLKDASACAIYGARAAYGVILVTTKHGEEGKMRVNYQGSVGWNAPTVLPKMVNSYDFVQYWNAGVANANSSRLYSEEKIKLLQQYINDPSSVNPWAELPANASMNPAFENTEKGVGNVDYFKLHYKDFAFKQQHNVSLSGGGKQAQYYVSGGYLKEDGILRYAKMKFERMNLTSNLSSRLTEWLKMKMNVKFVHSNNGTPFGDGGISEGFYHSLARFRPTISDIDPNGHFTELTMIPYLQSGTFTRTKRDHFDITTGFELNPFKGLVVNMDYTYKLISTGYEAKNVAPLIYAADGVTTSKGVRDELSVTPDGKYTRSNYHTHYQNISLYGNYTFSLADNNFTLMGGYQEENNKYDYLRNVITGLYSETNPNVGMGTGDKQVTDIRNGWATRGFFGRINYDYKGRYLLELNGRYDGSSRFASNHRWGFFPSVSVGWNITHEKFMQLLTDKLSLLKLRLSYGRLGNQAGAGLYTFASTMNLSSGLGNYYFADGRHMYLTAPGVVNPATTWEKVSSKNLGIDFGFFGNALTGSFDIYERKTKDMLGPGVDFPDFFGADAPQTNNAALRDRGWELTINYRGKIGEDINYMVGGSLSDSRSVVTDYANPTGTAPASNWYTGRRVGEIWGYRTDGLIQTQEEADEYNRTHDNSFFTSQKWTPGDVAFRDLNGDKKVNNGKNTLADMGDMTVIGNSTPRYQYTLNGTISWKGLSLSVMFQGVGKRDWDPTGSVYFWGCGPYAQVTVFKEHLDYWSKDNPNAYYPKPYINSAGGLKAYSAKTKNHTTDRYLQNAAYCRLKNLTVSYILPQTLTQKLKLQQVKVFFSGENLLTITKLKKMFDPEVIYTSNGYTGEGGKNYPMNKVLSVGLSVNL